jgi:hypothetical protein
MAGVYTKIYVLYFFEGLFFRKGGGSAKLRQQDYVKLRQQDYVKLRQQDYVKFGLMGCLRLWNSE